MKVYHYTSIETLALILKNKTIRFNRLDQVDDLNESAIGSGLLDTKLGNYVFVSCWSDNATESIPMWSMYSNWCSGVRIELEKDMFYEYNHNIDTGFIKGSITTILPEKDIIGEDYITTLCIIPLSEMYTKIVYTDDVENHIANAISGNMGELIKMPEVGKYKSPLWEFQKEVRFRIFAFPYDKTQIGKGSDENVIFKPMRENRKISRTYFDVPLKDNVFDNMKILLGPSINPNDEEIVYTLVSKYCSHASIGKSKLTGTVNFRK